MRLSLEQIIAVIAILNALFLTTLVGMIVMQPEFTGQVITAEGGKITYLNLTQDVQAGTWSVLYGNLTTGTTLGTPIILNGGEVQGFNLQADLSGEVIIIFTNATDFNISEMVPGNATVIDDFLGMSPSYAASGSQTFSGTGDFTLLGSLFTAPITHTNAQNGSYPMGLFNYSGNMVFVTKRYTNNTGFNGVPNEYQMLLPVVDPTTYRIYTYTHTSSALDCSIPVNMSVTYNGSRMELNWTPHPGATYYEVRIKSNLTSPYNSSRFMYNFSDAQIINESTLSLVFDNMTSGEQFFRVFPTNGISTCEYNQTIAALELPLYNDGSEGLNLISSPVNLTDPSIHRLLQPIFPYLIRAYSYDNAQKLYSPFLVIPDGFGGYIPIDMIGNITPNNGYWIEVSQNTSIMLVGELIEKVQANLTPELNLLGPGYYEGPTDVKTVFTQLYGNMTSVYQYDNVQKVYSVFLVIPDGFGGFIPIALFDYFHPKNAYYIGVTSTQRFTWPE